MTAKNHRHVGHFISAVVFFQLFPLIPLWFEYMHTKDIAMDSYVLGASMYAFATGFSSQKESTLSLCFLTGLLLAGAYKSKIIEASSALPFHESAASYGIAFVFFIHFFERRRRHLVDKEVFFLFQLTNPPKPDL
jgi:hypothetical protein